MTHDELLAVLNEVIEDDIHHLATQTAQALRAVIELHEPRASVAPEYPKGFTVGKDCSMCDMNYPCPTIQAIEGALEQ